MLKLTPRSVPKVWLPTKFSEFGQQSGSTVNLAGCENCRTSERVLRALVDPDPRLLIDHWESQDTRLRAKLAKLHSVEPTQIFLTSGAMNAIGYAFDVFAQSGTKVGILKPDFPCFPWFAEKARAVVVSLPRVKYPFVHSVTDVLRFVEGGIDFLITSNPSAVTGTRKSLGKIELLIKSAPETLFVVDEADAIDSESAACLTPAYQNLVVIRSFSKFYGLSGLRIGYIVIPTTFAEHFARMINPIELTSLAILAATEVLDDFEYQRDTQERVKKSLRILEEACRATAYRVVPGSSCFASYIWADESVEDPHLLLKRNNVDIVRGADFGLDRGGRINLSDPEKVQIAADVIRQTAAQ